jgi:hypothetical protein
MGSIRPSQHNLIENNVSDVIAEIVINICAYEYVSNRRETFNGGRVPGKLPAFVPANPSAKPDSIVVDVDFDDRVEFLAAALTSNT